MRYLFSGYTFDTERRELLCGAAAISVTPQVFDFLEYLIRNRERVVSKDDLIAAIWSGRIVSDAALTTRLNAARSAIGDSGDRQSLIKTLPRKGLRFVGKVREEPAAAQAAASLSLPDRPSVAVAAVSNSSGDSNLDFLGQGLEQDILVELARLRWLIVSARDAKLDAENAAGVEKFGHSNSARYILEGNIRCSAGRLRITAQLIDRSTGAHLWAEHYDRDSSDTFAVQDEIPQAIASATAPAIIHAERHRALRKRPENLGAWEAYQLGMLQMSRCEAAANSMARTYFQRAIDIDPHFAPGYSALAWSQMMSASIFSEMTVAEGCMLGDPLVRQAIALDENDLEARARGALAELLKGDIEGAFQSATQILSIDETCADALGVKGAALVYSGRRREGRSALRRYLKLRPNDPARPIRLAQIAASQYLDADYEQAALTARQVIRKYPTHPSAYRWLAASLGQSGRRAEAEEALQNLMAISPSSFDMYVRQRPPKYCIAEYAPMLEGLRKAGWKD